MPISRKKARKKGDTRTTPQPRKPAHPDMRRQPDHALRTQVRGGRPPRFPGRTGGR